MENATKTPVKKAKTPAKVVEIKLVYRVAYGKVEIYEIKPNKSSSRYPYLFRKFKKPAQIQDIWSPCYFHNFYVTAKGAKAAAVKYKKDIVTQRRRSLMAALNDLRDARKIKIK